VAQASRWPSFSPTLRCPLPGSRPSAAVCHFGSFLSLPAFGGPLVPQPARLWRVFCPPLPVPGPWPMTDDKGPMTVVPHSAICNAFPRSRFPPRRRRFSLNPSSAFGVYPPWRAVSAVKAVGRCCCHSALRTPHCFSPFPPRRGRFSPDPSSAYSAVSAVKERRVPRRCFFATSYPQPRMPKSACQKPSNSSQNRSKRRRFPSKSDQKRAHFVMPILTFWGVTPSGASARADLAFRKGQKPGFRGSEMPCAKVIHKMGITTGNREPARGGQARERGTGNGGIWRPPPAAARLLRPGHEQGHRPDARAGGDEEGPEVRAAEAQVGGSLGRADLAEEFPFGAEDLDAVAGG